MKNLKSCLSLILVMTMLLLCFTSCGKKDAGELISTAEAKLSEAPYTMNMKITYESEDPATSEAIGAFSVPVLTIAVNGTDFDAHMEMGKGDLTGYIDYVYVDGVLYTEVCDGTYTSKSNENVSEMDTSGIKSALGASVSIGYSDFKSTSVISSGGIDIITCTDLNVEALDLLVRELTAQLKSLGAFVMIENVSLVIEIADGRYHATALVCQYVITVGEEIYEFDMTYTAEFDYESEVSVTAPWA